jgi:transposase-like protein
MRECPECPLHELRRVQVCGVRTELYDQPDAEAGHAQFDRIVDAPADKLPAVAAHLEQARADILASPATPRTCGGRSGATIPTNA